MRHGTLAGYVTHRCRCEDCRRASWRYDKLRNLDNNRGRPRTVDATGTIRRIRALMAIGWPVAHLADRLGMSYSALKQMTSRQDRVFRSTAEKVDALFEELCMTPGPSAMTAGHAKARGYAPPLAWDNIDDPHEAPQLGDKPDGRGNSLEDVEWLVRNGYDTWPSLCTRVGKTRENVRTMLRRNNKFDLLRLLDAAEEGAA